MIRTIITLCLLALMGNAEAQPVTNLITGQPYTLPAQFSSTGSPYKTGYTDTGRWMAYLFTRDGQQRIQVFCIRYTYTLIEPETSHLKTFNAVFRAYVDANVRTNCSIDPDMRPMYLAAREAFGLR